MSDARRTRLPLVAVSLAGVAVVVAGIAAVRVLTRDDASASQAAVAGAGRVLERHVAATDVVQIPAHLEAVFDAGQPRGVRVNETALASALGLADDDIVVSLSGRTVTSVSDINAVLRRVGGMQVTALYVELERRNERVVMRWLLDGDLRDARRDQIAALAPTAPSGSGQQALMPLLDKIEAIDDTHVRVPRPTFEALLDALPVLARGARVVPSVRNGQPDGYKLYAIRPDSVYARVGIMNGDTVKAINRDELSEVDDVLELFVNLRHADEIRIELDRGGRMVGITVEITK